MKSIAFTNRKGGVGKSSCVMHLGIRFAQMGMRTLLVDLDPQASLSQGLLGREALEIEQAKTLAVLYDYPGSGLEPIERAGGREGLDLVPGHERMFHYNTPDPWEAGDDQFTLRDALAEVAVGYDLVLIDCPPHIQFCGWSALVAADAAIVPAQLEDFGVQGVSAILDTVDLVHATVNPRLRLLGILGTMVDRRLSIHAAYRADLGAAFGNDLFAEGVPASTDYKTAVTLRRGITEHKPRGEASKALCRVADEVLARLESRCGVPAVEEVTR